MTLPNQSMKSRRSVNHLAPCILVISLVSVAIAEADQSEETARMHGPRWFTLRHDLIDWFGSVIEPSPIVTNCCQLSIALERLRTVAM